MPKPPAAISIGDRGLHSLCLCSLNLSCEHRLRTHHVTEAQSLFASQHLRRLSYILPVPPTSADELGRNILALKNLDPSDLGYQMCHRQVRLTKMTICGHLTLDTQSIIDCQEKICYNSSAHPSDCRAGGKSPCSCRRYFKY